MRGVSTSTNTLRLVRSFVHLEHLEVMNILVLEDSSHVEDVDFFVSFLVANLAGQALFIRSLFKSPCNDIPTIPGAIHFPRTHLGNAFWHSAN